MASQNVSSPFGNRQWGSAQALSFVATNPTPGTGLQSATITTYSATADGHLAVANNYALTSNRYVFMDKVKFILSGTAPTATTNMHLFGIMDTLALIPSAGSVSLVPVCVNGGAANTTSTVVYVPTGAAALTIPAKTAANRLVHRCCIPTSLGITGDEYGLVYGSDAPPSACGGGTAVRATAAGRFITDAPAICIPPQSIYVLNMWWLTQATTAPTFEWEVCFTERVLP